MTRQDLEHLIRASATIADDDEIIVVGSQSILGQFPNAPAELCVSDEADVYPRNHPERADLIDGAIGELSAFHDTFGYYAQGVGVETSTLPSGWESRLIAITNDNTRGATGWCLEVHDLFIAKAAAGRPKDLRFLRATVTHGLVEQDTLLERVSETSLSESLAEVVRGRIDALFERT